MRVADVVGGVLLVGVVIGGVVYFVAKRPLSTGLPAQTGGTVAVQPTANGYQPTAQQPRDTTGTDVANVIVGISGVGAALFGSGLLDGL